jgi:DNA topoisomerase-6 subunit A
MKYKERVRKKLIELGKSLIEQAKEGKNPHLEITIRALSNVNWDENSRMLQLGEKKAKRYMFNLAHIRKFTQTLEVAATAKELLEADKHLHLREVFYRIKRTLPGTNINVVDEQDESDRAIEDLELIVGHPREQLHINANKMGAVVGNVVIKDRGDSIDWSKLGSGGWSIPSNVEDIEFKKVDAEFVIYVEKSAEWERMHEDKVWKKLNCILICSQGQATRGIRRLLQRLHEEFDLPIYVLTDFDPWGIYIYSVLKFGSINLAHMSQQLAIPDIKFLGLTGDDIEKYGLKRHIIRFKEVDEKRLQQIANYPWFKNRKEWQRQFKLMKDMKGKVELAALSSKGITFISDVYLPEKIKNEEWLD